MPSSSSYYANTTTGELQWAQGPAKPGWVPLADLEPSPLLWRAVLLRLDDLERAYDTLLEVLDVDRGIEVGDRPRRGLADLEQILRGTAPSA